MNTANFSLIETCKCAIIPGHTEALLANTMFSENSELNDLANEVKSARNSVLISVSLMAISCVADSFNTANELTNNRIFFAGIFVLSIILMDQSSKALRSKTLLFMNTLCQKSNS